MRASGWARKPSAGLLIVALLGSLPCDVRTQTSPALKSTATPPTDETVDGGWPRNFVTASGADLVIYQPQILSWDARQRMVAYAAVAYQPKQAKTPSLGTIRMEANTSAALEDRLVRFSPVALTESNFGALPKPQVQEIVTTIQAGLPESERVIALDRILANIDQSQIIPKNVEGVKADPPQIFFSTRPAILIGLDGDPVWSPIANNDLKFAVNTNWDLFQHEQLKTYFLRNDRYWLKASELKGPWTPAGTLPGSFAKLPADENWKDVKSALPGAALDPKLVPVVHVSMVPSEMILLTGNPTYAPVSGTKLLWVNNTESDLFRLGQNGPVYFLVAGRWFSAPAFTGPWAFASTSLPEDFKRISLEHPRSRVLASVPGTPQAAEAVLLTQVPQTARVNRKQLQAPDVTYQGDPQFAPIETTKMSRAVNTDKDIIKVGDVYYMCFQGVWFMAKSANGPWAVTDSVPGEIYTIPASSPSHNVTYVTVVEDDDDEWVTYAAVAGYTGMMVAWGCAVWGTGYYYPPYVGYGGFYPVYYPFYPTYGYGAWYNPWTGGYGRGAAWYGPYGGAGVAARYNPRTGTYARGAVAWGPGGARGAAAAYNPRTGAYGRTQQGSGIYGSWGATGVQRGNDWVQTARVTNRATGNTTRVTQGSGGGEAVTRRGPGADSGVVRTGSGDVYAGRDGNVYRKNDTGGWQKYDDGSWGSVNTPTPRDGATTRAADRPTTGATDRTATAPARTQPSSDTVGQLDRDSAARAEGTARTRDYGAARSTPTTRSSGTYRPSGGGMRGGGRRR